MLKMIKSAIHDITLDCDTVEPKTVFKASTLSYSDRLLLDNTLTTITANNLIIQQAVNELKVYKEAQKPVDAVRINELSIMINAAQSKITDITCELLSSCLTNVVNSETPVKMENNKISAQWLKDNVAIDQMTELILKIMKANTLTDDDKKKLGD
jgi:hypothetical protein